MNKRYYEYVLELVSPLSLGSGLNRNSDSDVLRDGKGRPFIPATSIAGVLASRLNDDDKKRLFGSDKGGDFTDSKVIFYDAVLTNKASTVTVRDGVALEDRVAKDSAKFDFEAVEQGVCFKGYFELDDKLSSDDEKQLLNQLSALNSGILRLGHKTTRGYGQVRVNKLNKLAFTDIDKWLEFDMYGDWNGAEDIELLDCKSDTDVIRLELTLKSALSIREYTTELPDGSDNDTAPDYKFMSLKHNGTPIIPGTTWAGAFRDRFTEFMGEDARKVLFGYVEQYTKNTAKSKITFSESVFKKGSYTEKLITRNSIDRFSAATNDGALYTELTIFGGKTELTITLPRDKDIDNSSKAAVFACIVDLDNGFMSIGGLASVGRGLFGVDKLYINGKDMTNVFKTYDLKKLTEEVQ